MANVDSQNKDFYEVLARLRDLFNGAAEVLDSYIQQQTKVILKEYDPEKIKWENKEGKKGPFQQSEDFKNAEFNALRKDLGAHNGKLYHKGFFYWVFQNGQTIGRKKAMK